MEIITVEKPSIATHPVMQNMLVGCRIPKDFFITMGKGESNITVHAGSYHLALKEAGIERYNIMVYSSILPGVAQKVMRPVQPDGTHGAVMETIMAVANSHKDQRATAAIIFGWLYNKKTGKKYGGLVCEYNGHDPEEHASQTLHAALNELYTNGFDEEFDLKDIELNVKSFIPSKQYGTALVALCFQNYIFPILES